MTSPFAYLDQLSQKLVLIGIDHETTFPTEGPKPSRLIDAQSAKSLGRISVWLSDEWDFEVLDIDSEQSVFAAHLDHPTDEQLSDTFEEWLENMK